MIFFFIFILILSIYEIKQILKNGDNKKASIIVYLLITSCTIFAGIYYYTNQYGNSIIYYILKLLNVKY
jgi:hypothetical protein